MLSNQFFFKNPPDSSAFSDSHHEKADLWKTIDPPESSTGPSFVAGFQQVGWSLFLVGAGATTLPLVLGVLIGRYLFRFNDALTLGCVAGARTTTAALGAVEDTIGSNVPSLGYTITYAIGNTLLIIWGVVLVLLLA